LIAGGRMREIDIGSAIIGLVEKKTKIAMEQLYISF